MIISAMGQASKSDWFYYMIPWVQTRLPGGHRHFSPELSHAVHLFDILFVIALIVGIFDLCHDDNGSEFDFVVFLSLLRGFKCFLMLMKFAKYKQVVRAVQKCIPAIAPQFNLFVVVFFAFAVIGQGLFAGCTTENAPQGPGDWTADKYAGPFADAANPENASYVDLNFDNMWAAVATLFMLMIQNNWQVEVDGYVKCTETKWARIYFVVFNIITAMIMINILTGVLLDLYTLHAENTKEDIKKQYMLLITRLEEFNYPLLSNGDPPSDDDARLAIEAQAAEDAVTAAQDAVADAQASGDADALAAAKQALADAEATAQAAKNALAKRSTQSSEFPLYSEKLLSVDWEIREDLNTELLTTGLTISDVIKLASEAELSPMEEMVQSLPMPVYVRTSGNRIAFCNDLFSHLYGVKDDKCTDGRCQCTNDIVGDCSNFKLTKEYWEAKSKDKDATVYLQKNNDGTPRPFDERPMTNLKNKKKSEYTSDEFLKQENSLMEVVFKCNEKPVKYAQWGDCTVVYMIPLLAETGSILLDINYDGSLNYQDVKHLEDLTKALRIRKLEKIGPFGLGQVEIEKMNLRIEKLASLQFGLSGGELHVDLQDFPQDSQMILADAGLDPAEMELSHVPGQDLRTTALLSAVSDCPGDPSGERRYFVYPLPGMQKLDADTISLLAGMGDSRISLLAFGGFVHTDEKGTVVAAAVVQEGDSICFDEPVHETWMDKSPWTEMRQKLINGAQIQPCTIPFLTDLGITGFCWLASSQIIEMDGMDDAPDGSKWSNGAFLYVYENHPHFDCFCPANADSTWNKNTGGSFALKENESKAQKAKRLLKQRQPGQNHFADSEDEKALQFNGMCVAWQKGPTYRLVHLTVRPELKQIANQSKQMTTEQYNNEFTELDRMPFSDVHKLGTVLRELLPEYKEDLDQRLGDRHGMENILPETRPGGNIEKSHKTLPEMMEKLAKDDRSLEHIDVIVAFPNTVEKNGVEKNEKNLGPTFTSWSKTMWNETQGGPTLTM